MRGMDARDDRTPRLRGLHKRVWRRARRGARALRTGKAHPASYAALVVLAGAIGATAVFLVGSANRAADRRALLAYEEAISEPATRGGSIVEQEIKRAVNQFNRGELPAADLKRFAPNWAGLMRQVRDDFVAVKPPSFLGDIDRKWARAFNGYLEAIELFRAAADVSGPARKRAMTRAFDTADGADDLYDEASRVIQTWRRRFGLQPTSRFPDPEGRASEGVIEPT